MGSEAAAAALLTGDWQHCAGARAMPAHGNRHCRRRQTHRHHCHVHCDVARAATGAADATSRAAAATAPAAGMAGVAHAAFRDRATLASDPDSPLRHSHRSAAAVAHSQFQRLMIMMMLRPITETRPARRAAVPRRRRRVRASARPRTVRLLRSARLTDRLVRCRENIEALHVGSVETTVMKSFLHSWRKTSVMFGQAFALILGGK
jgi:hypothetical protein